MTPGDKMNRRREECPCCQSAGRVGDSPCMRGCAASLPYYVDLQPNPDHLRYANELAIQLAANHGG